MYAPFTFDELTWPEVVALPRDTPLVLPLGSLINPTSVSTLLKVTQPVGILPSIPFGWKGSGLEVQEQVFADLVCNLVGNLLEDGFAAVHVLTPAGLDLGSGIPTLELPALNAARSLRSSSTSRRAR